MIDQRRQVKEEGSLGSLAPSARLRERGPDGSATIGA